MSDKLLNLGFQKDVVPFVTGMNLAVRTLAVPCMFKKFSLSFSSMTSLSSFYVPRAYYGVELYSKFSSPRAWNGIVDTSIVKGTLNDSPYPINGVAPSNTFTDIAPGANYYVGDSFRRDRFFAYGYGSPFDVGMLKLYIGHGDATGITDPVATNLDFNLWVNPLIECDAIRWDIPELTTTPSSGFIYGFRSFDFDCNLYRVSLGCYNLLAGGSGDYIEVELWKGIKGSAPTTKLHSSPIRMWYAGGPTCLDMYECDATWLVGSLAAHEWVGVKVVAGSGALDAAICEVCLWATPA